MTAAISAADRGRRAAEAMAGYEATLIKKERIGGELLQSELRLKLRHEPFAIYLKYVTPHAGRQVLYRNGENDGQMMVSQTGLAALFGTMSVAPGGTLAMKENRHPITSAGMANLAAKLVTQWSAVRPDDVTVKRYPDAQFGGYRCEAFEVASTRDRVPFAISRLFLDFQTGLPVRAQRYDRPANVDAAPVLVEDYSYVDLNLRTRLTSLDFNPANPAYGFE